MNPFKRFLQRLLGEIKAASVSASVPGDRVPPDIVGLAEFSRKATRSDPELAPPGPALTGLTHEDVDPNTGGIYPDYVERRRQREAARAGAKEGRLVGVVNHDVFPD